MEDKLFGLLNLYEKLPKSLKYLIGRFYYFIPARVKHGGFYSIYQKRIQEFNKLKDPVPVQNQLLFENVNFAVRNIPFYKKFKEITTLEEFRKLPVIHKSFIKENFEELINPSITDKRLPTNTGGSSGTPFEFYLEKNVSRPKEKAHFDWFWGNFGYKKSDKILMVRGKALANNALFEYRSLDNHLNISCYSVNEKNIETVLKEINRFKPDIIHAYPSSLKIVTSLLEPYRNNLELKINAIFLGSEYLPDMERNYFGEFYRAQVVSWYGHTERLLHGGNCMHSDAFHFYPFYGYLELLDERDEIITTPGKEGRIVATGFDNRVMPFIRYDTGDLGILSETNTCTCGYKGPILTKIVGRNQDIIVLSDGTNVSLTAFIFGQHLKEFRKIREMQIFQEKTGEIEIRVVKSEGFSSRDEQSFTQTLLNSVNHKLKIKIKHVDRLEKTVSGKNKFFISSINQSQTIKNQPNIHETTDTKF